jgi:hypothetical protein
MTPNDQTSREATTRRWLRLDLAVSFLALLFSAFAALGTWYQSKLVADELNATVWPYVEFSTTFTHGKEIELAIRNDGTGPAILRGIEASVGGHVYHEWPAVLVAIGYRPPTKERPNINQSSLDYGEVLRAGQTVAFLDVTDKALFDRLAKTPVAYSIRACYCSILGRCWIVSTTDTDTSDVPNCDAFSRSGMATGTVR